jgi:HlyD family secretion protein
MAAAASLVLVMVGVSACGSTTLAPPTTHVQRGAVSTRVSASGALASVTSQNLGFAQGGQLKELGVRVGDVVKPGQVLAREDDFPFRQLLAQQQANLDTAQANLDRANNDVSVPDAKRSANQQHKILEKTKDQVDASNDAAAAATKRAKVAYEFAWHQLYKARQALKTCTPPSTQTPSMSATPPDPTNPATANDPNDPTSTTSMASAAAMNSMSSGAPSSGGSTSGSTGALGALTKAVNPNSSTAATAPMTCDNAKTAYTSALNSAIQAKTAYVNAKHQEEVNHESNEVSLANAKQMVISQENGVDSARVNRPAAVAIAAASVASAQALVAQAQRNVDNAVLYAPVGGTVSSITGTVGEFLGAGAGTSALAPGTDAAIPGVGAAATSDSSGNASSGLSATRPGGGAFIVLNNLATFQVVVPFEESDAAKVAPNQKVQVSFDAVPDLERDGTVLSIAPNGTNISGVTNYYATILLNQSDPRLKAGQTAEAGVLTSSRDNVLVVPNSAVIKQGNGSYVNVAGPDGKPVLHQFQPGLVGDDNTEVLSGLNEGQQIMLPQAQPRPGAGSGSTSGGGGRGGGGGGG